MTTATPAPAQSGDRALVTLAGLWKQRGEAAARERTA